MENTIKSGIYCIKNTINNKVYIGSAKNLKHRINKHKYDLKNNKHYNKHLQSSWNKYGEESFSFEIIRYVKNLELLIRFEQVYINRTQCYINTYGFNKRKIAESNIGNKISEFGRHNMSLAKKGTKMHLNTVLAIKNSINPRNKGKKQSKETRKLHSEIMKDFWKNKTKEDKKLIGEKISKSLIGKKRPNQKISRNVIDAATKAKLKPIIQFDMNWIKIKEWDSIKQCCEALKLQGSLINKVIKGERKHTGKFKFRLKIEA